MITGKRDYRPFRPCPSCGEFIMHPVKVMNALSRRDNNTYVCSPCGVKEAMEDFVKSQLQKIDTGSEKDEKSRDGC